MANLLLLSTCLMLALVASAAKFGVLMELNPSTPNSTWPPGFGILDGPTGDFEQLCTPLDFVESDNERVLVHFAGAFRAALMGNYQPQPYLQTFPSTKMDGACPAPVVIDFPPSLIPCPIWALIAGKDSLYGVYLTEGINALGIILRIGLDGEATEFAIFPARLPRPFSGLSPSQRVGDYCSNMEGGMFQDRSSGHLFFYANGYSSGVSGDSTWWVELDAEGKLLRNATVDGHYWGLVPASDGRAYGIGTESPFTGQKALVSVDLQSLKMTTVQTYGPSYPYKHTELGPTALDTDAASLVSTFNFLTPNYGPSVLHFHDLKSGKLDSGKQLSGAVWAIAAASDVAPPSHNLLV